MKCPSCSRELADGGVQACPFCAADLPTAPSPLSSSGTGTGESRFPPGRILAGRYRIVTLLGQGGMGEVYRADDLKLGQPVALKFLPPHAEGDERYLEILRGEVRLARQVTHPNVCRVYDVGELDGLHFLSMELIEGEDLASLLKRIGRLARVKAVEVGAELAAGLAAVHQRGLLHRDFKPANVMIDKTGRSRITDFGLAVPSSDSGALMAGTPAYMPPEQRAGGKTTVKSDLYALGLVLYELMTGRRPALGDDGPPPPSRFVRDLPPEVDDVVLRCLDPDPERRPGSAEEVAAALAASSAPPFEPAPGVQVPHRSHWVLERRLGRGGFGEVWLTRHQKTGDRRVFKLCHDPERRRALEREITLFRLLKEELGEREDIARILDWNFDEPPYFLEAEYTPGGNLREWAEAQGGLAAIPLETRLELAAQVATALAAAHSIGVLHKDVKPTNVLVARGKDGEPQARLADFGIGAALERYRLADAGITALGFSADDDGSSSSYGGTRLYMAPEVLEGKVATMEADVYGLGIVLYQMVVGDFSRALAPGWQRDVPCELLATDIAATVDGAPERRPGAAALAERLRSLDARRAARDEERRLLAAAELARRSLRRARRRRKWAAAVAAVLVLLGVALGLAFEEADKTATQALAEQTLENLHGFGRLAAAAVDHNLDAVVRRLEREAQSPELRRLVADLGASDDGRRRAAEAGLQDTLDALHQRYADRHFFSWGVADRDAALRARAPRDERIIGRRYAYREWWSGVERPPGETEGVDVPPRRTIGLTLGYRSTARGNPTLMSVSAPVLAPGRDGDDTPTVGVISATLHLDTFNEWLAVAEPRTPGRSCPDVFVLLLHRGQLLRHPCPDPEAPRPPIEAEGFAATEEVRGLLDEGFDRSFVDPLRHGSRGLASAAPLTSHPDWQVVVVEEREAALRPLTRLSSRLRRLGQLATVVGLAALVGLVALFFLTGREEHPGEAPGLRDDLTSPPPT